MVTAGIRELRSERADALSLNSCGAQLESMQPPGVANYFFDSAEAGVSTLATLALVLVLLEVDLGQSFAM